MSLGNFTTMTRLEIESICTAKKTVKEYSGPCPNCQSSSRLCWWPEGGRHYDFFCFDCELCGYIVDSSGNSPRFDPSWREEWQRKQAEAAAEYARDRKKWAARLNEKQTHVEYQENLNGHTQYVQDNWGLDRDTIKSRMIGYAPTCPTFSKSDSLTIPWFVKGQVIEIRHRLLQPEEGKGKYRTQRSGPFNGLYNLDSLRSETDWIILTEGEFKVMVIEQHGLSAIGLPGITCFQAEWADLFKHLRQVFIVFDPGRAEMEWAGKTAGMIAQAGVKVRVAEMPDKVDDLLVKRGMDIGTLAILLESGRTYHA